MNYANQIYLVVGMLVAIGGFIGMYAHEEAHQETFKQFNCTGNINYRLIRPSFTPINCVINSSEERLALKIANSNIESNYEFFRFDFYLSAIIVLLVGIFKTLYVEKKNIYNYKWKTKK